MAKQILVLALIFFAAVGMAAATTPSTSASLAPSAEDEGGDHVIGSVSGGAATDAAPVGGPVPEGVFPNLAPAPAPGSGAAALEVTTIAGAIAAAGLVGSFFC